MPRNRQFWIGKIASGAIAGVGGGPPCETFSAARLLEHGPPPLRSYDEPLGLPCNSQRQWLQTTLGTTLMQFIIEMLVWCACSGGCGFLEHPAYPVWSIRSRPASTWASKPIRWLKRLHCSAVTTFDQCLFGCEGRKPTTFLTIRLPHLRHLIRGLGHRGRCNHGPVRHPPLQGLNSHGEFKTAIAKIYPQALSAAVASAFVQYAFDLFY